MQHIHTIALGKAGNSLADLYDDTSDIEAKHRGVLFDEVAMPLDLPISRVQSRRLVLDEELAFPGGRDVTLPKFKLAALGGEEQSFLLGCHDVSGNCEGGFWRGVLFMRVLNKRIVDMAYSETS